MSRNKKKKRQRENRPASPAPEPRHFSILPCSLGLLAILFQLPLIRMMLGDTRSFFLGSWDGLAFIYFLLIVFVLIPGLMIGGLWALKKWTPISPRTVFLALFAFVLAGQIIFYLPHPERLPVDPRSLVPHLIIVGLIFWLSSRFSRPVLEVFKVLSILPPFLAVWFSINVWAVSFPKIEKHPEAAPAVQAGDTPVFFLTFEKLVLRYFTDEKGNFLKDQFPNLAAFVEDADYYPNTYANTMATTWSLPALYTGRIVGFTEPWWTKGVDVKEILGRNRKRIIISDVNQPWCVPERDVCVRVIGFHRTEIITGWLKTYVKTILPASMAAGMKIQDWAFNPWEDMWDQEMTHAGDAEEALLNIGNRQMDKLISLVRFYEGAPHLYLMHNFISDSPGAKFSELKPDTNTKTYEEDLKVIRKNLSEFDRSLGEFMTFLKESGLYEKSLILVTADTGYDPAAGHLDWIDKEVPLSDMLTRVFLALKKPGQTEGRVVKTELQQVDVLPTVLNVLGIDPKPFGFQGTPASQLPEINHTLRPFYFALGTGRGIFYFIMDFQNRKMVLARQIDLQRPGQPSGQ